VRAIAISTAIMVLTRYGLRIVAIDSIGQAFNDDEQLIAAFLGRYRYWANLAGAILGLLVVPRIITWAGVGAANILYATATFVGYALLAVAPSLTTAVTARFIDLQFKDALRTPLSALFYGAEPRNQRAQARALMFGAVIPIATLTTAAVFRKTSDWGPDLRWVLLAGSCLAACFVAASWFLNRRWRQRQRVLLRCELEDEASASSEHLATAKRFLADLRTDENTDVLELIARGFASESSHLQGLAEEVLAETVNRRRAHAVAEKIRIALRATTLMNSAS
jgi:hypothetical protein